MSIKKSLLLVGASILVVTACVLPCGLAIGWMLQGGPSNDGWDWQDLQDHLASNGMETNRASGDYAGKSGMWFVRGNGEPIDFNTLKVLNNRDGGPLALHDGNKGDGICFFVEQLPSPQEARKMAAKIRDTQQKDSLSSGRFVFHGSPAQIKKLREILP